MIKEERPKVGRPATYTPEQVLERLIGAAVEILNEQAANADFSVAQVAQRAKVSKRTVYTVISTKEELIHHIIRHGAKVATTMLDLPVASAADARSVLARFLTEWAHFACGPQAVGIYVMAIRERSRFPAIGEAYYHSRSEHGLKQLAGWFERIGNKKFCPVQDPTLTADLALTMAAAERQRILALGIDRPYAPDELEARVRTIVQLVFRDPLPCSAG
jgi:AcrR family transcriptional regulator